MKQEDKDQAQVMACIVAFYTIVLFIVISAAKLVDILFPTFWYRN